MGKKSAIRALLESVLDTSKVKCVYSDKLVGGRKIKFEGMDTPDMKTLAELMNAVKEAYPMSQVEFETAEKQDRRRCYFSVRFYEKKANPTEWKKVQEERKARNKQKAEMLTNRNI